MVDGKTADTAWLKAYNEVLKDGHVCSPRGKKIIELPQYTSKIDMLYPVVRIKERKLNYRFMAAEALWILSGRNDVAFLSSVNPHIAQFSDDGVILSGAYGKQIIPQLDYVVNKLIEDRDTRQATMTLWKPNPAPSKDIPCTIALDFKIRRHQLNCHVFMRSSDIWLGLPYDIFAFSMISFYVAACYNDEMKRLNKDYAFTIPGTLYITAASSHLYEQHWGAGEMTYSGPGEIAPKWWRGVPQNMIAELGHLKDSKKDDDARWWNR